MANENKNKLDIKFLTQIGMIILSGMVFILSMNYKIDLLRNDMQHYTKILDKVVEDVEDIKIRVTILETTDG